MKEKYNFQEFCEIIDVLLGENGCPWDRAQTHQSLLPHLLEECYEVIDAARKDDFESLSEELGDVLLQVVMQSKIAEQGNRFTMDEVTAKVSRKMINRHPHIFGTAKADTQEAVLDNWEVIKKQEKGYESHTEVLKSVPSAMPALLRALKVQKSAQKSGLDTGLEVGNDNQPLAVSVSRLCEQASRLSEHLQKGGGDWDALIGELLFTVVAISRKTQINPEFALTNAVEQFINRFEYVENLSLFTGEAVQVK